MVSSLFNNGVTLRQDREEELSYLNERRRRP
jgi:hypothetical protein